MKKLLITSTLLLAIGAMTSMAHAAPPGDRGMGEAPAKSGMSNSNGKFSTDRDKGLARAEDRRNAHSMMKKHTKRHARRYIAR